MLNIDTLFTGQKETDLNWLAKFKKKSFAKFTACGLPYKEIEEWKYANLDFFTNTNFTINKNLDFVTKINIEKFIFAANYNRIVFIDGVYQESLSHIQQNDNLVICSLSKAFKIFPDKLEKYLKIDTAKNTTIFADLNNAFINDGVYIHIKNRAHIENPIHILYLNSNKMADLFLNPYNLIILEEGSAANIIEHYDTLANNNHFTNTYNNIILQNHTNLLHYTINNQAEMATYINNSNICAQSGCNYQNFSFTLNGKFTRFDINHNFKQKNSSAKLYGFYQADKNRYVDYHTYLNHNAPDCMSHEFYKGIIKEHATAVFNGKITVLANAHKTHAELKNKNLLLHKTATINTKPELEIYADDVKCNHGATIGQIDNMALTYLRARGINELEAQKLLIFAFINEILEIIPDKNISHYLAKDLLGAQYV